MNGKKSNVVLTGAAIISCLGADRFATWQRVRRGECGMRPLTALELPLPPDRLGGQALDIPDDSSGASPEPRASRYLRRAIADALRDAGVGIDGRPNPYPPHRCGFMIGTTLHGMRSGGAFLRSGDFGQLGQFLASATLRDAARGVAGPAGIDGFAATTCSACSSSLGSIALATTLLESGEFDLILAGGYDTISEYAYGGFNSLRLVADGPLRPFSRNRQGMKLAEGFGIVVLERAADARRRGARILARVLGCGESADAHHLTQPHPEGDGAARAMSEAIERAGLTPGDIGLVAAHATGTPDNDAGEFAALSRVFGQKLPQTPVVAFKSHLGHTLGGAGAVELILAAMAMAEQIAPPCANVKADEIEFPGLKLCLAEATPRRIRATLNTSLGFGGANTCIVLGEASEPPEIDSANEAPAPRLPVEASAAAATSSGSEEDVFITGIGVVLPGAVGNDAFVALLNKPAAPVAGDTGSIAEEHFAHLLNSRRIRRMSDYSKLTLAATALALKDAGIDDVPAFAAECSVIAGTNHGSSQYCQTYYKAIVDEGLIGANPMLFAEGVPNAAAAHLSLMLSLKGACQTLIGSRTAGLDALRLASMRIRLGQWSRAIVSVAEEYSPLINSAYKHCGLYAGPDRAEDADAGMAFASGAGFYVGAGAVTFILESRRAMQNRSARARGRIEASATAAPGLSAGKATGRFPLHAWQRVYSELQSPDCVITSANGTWIDRAEADALRGTAVTATSLAGYIAECFSVISLAGAAAVLLSGRVPRLLNNEARNGGTNGFHLKAARGDETPGSFAVLASDYTGLVAGVRVGCVRAGEAAN